MATNSLFPLFFRVKVESGIRLSRLAQVLETISLSLHIRGRVPDLSLCDAIAIGTGGTGSRKIIFYYIYFYFCTNKNSVKLQVVPEIYCLVLSVSKLHYRIVA